MIEAWKWINDNAGVVGILVATATLLVAMPTLVAGIIAAQAGKRAASFAQDAVDQAERAQRIADQRYIAEIEPRPVLGRVTRSNDAEFTCEVVNAGGAAPLSILVCQRDTGVYVGSGTLPAHGSVPVRFVKRGNREVPGLPRHLRQPTIVLVAAKDVRGEWWDCTMRSLIGEALYPWWREAMQRLRLPAWGLLEAPFIIGITEPDRPTDVADAVS